MHHVKQQLYRFLILSLITAWISSLGSASRALGQEGLFNAGLEAEPEQQIRLAGSTSPRTALAFDIGRASGNETLLAVSLSVKQTPLQTKYLKKLLVEQQTVGTANYHRWLSPKQYGKQFGLNSDAMREVTDWLVSQGFTHPTINASHTAISFDGNLGRVEQVFSTEFHFYSTAAETVLANSVDLQVPASVSNFIDGVTHANQFRPTPQTSGAHMETAPRWTSASNGKHFLTPADLARIYDFSPLLSAGQTGKGQRIAVVGQSAIDREDIARFRAASGLIPRQPQLVLVPNTGSAVKKPGDEAESDIDLEYVSSTAPDADTILVYTGADPGHNVFDALAYAVDQDLAPVISVSYGQCESTLSKSEIASIEKTLVQASAQGQTVIVSSGDLGATACESEALYTRSPATHGLAVQYPASSAYVTSVGGTMFSDSDFSWAAFNNPDGGSAQSYIGEQAWSERRGTGQMLLLASGGGASAMFPKPLWQTAPGVPFDRARDIPDIAFAAAGEHDGYIFCSSDISIPVQGSCSHGFLDSAQLNLTIAGGTSFGAPITAGIAALLDQTSSTGRLGNLNPLLYSASVREPTAFHDITVGTNRQPCSAKSKNCSSDGTEGYSAAPGYDLVTGLGTLDVGHLAAALAAPTGSSTPLLSMSLHQIEYPIYTEMTAHILAVLSNPAFSPGGMVQFYLDGIKPSASVSVQNGKAEYAFSTSTVGTHSISAVFTSTSGRLTATANLELTIQDRSGAHNPAFVLSGAAIEPSSTSTASSTIVIASSKSYSGQIDFVVSTSDATLAAYGCYSISAVDLKATMTAYATLLVAQSGTACKSMAVFSGLTPRRFLVSEPPGPAPADASADQMANLSRKARFQGRVESALACCVLLLKRVRKRLRMHSAAAIAIISMITSLVGCGVTVTPGEAASGIYSVLVTGYDMLHPSTSASVSLPLEIK